MEKKQYVISHKTATGIVHKRFNGTTAQASAKRKAVKNKGGEMKALNAFWSSLQNSPDLDDAGL